MEIAALGSRVEFTGLGQHVALARQDFIKTLAQTDVEPVLHVQLEPTSRATGQIAYTVVEVHTTAKTAKYLLNVLIVLRGNMRKQ